MKEEEEEVIFALNYAKMTGVLSVWCEKHSEHVVFLHLKIWNECGGIKVDIDIGFFNVFLVTNVVSLYLR